MIRGGVGGDQRFETAVYNTGMGSREDDVAHAQREQANSQNTKKPKMRAEGGRLRRSFAIMPGLQGRTSLARAKLHDQTGGDAGSEARSPRIGHRNGCEAV